MPRARITPSKKRPLRERRRRARAIVLLLWTLLFIGVAGGSVYALHRSEVTIRFVSITGVRLVREDLARSVAEQALSGSYALVIPRRSTFFFPRSDIERELMKTFHPIQGAVVERAGLTGIAIYLTERMPDALWCLSAPSAETLEAGGTDSKEKESCFFMDMNGFVFAAAKDTSDRTDLLRFEGGNLSKPLGETYLPGAYQTLRRFLGDMGKTISRTPQRVFLDEHDDVHVFFKEGGEVRFAARDVGEPLLENVASVFASKRFTDGGAFEYVDFRFGSKVYIRWVE